MSITCRRDGLSDLRINVKFVLHKERSRLKHLNDTTAYCENSIKHANKLHGQNVGLNVGVGTCGYHWTYG